MKLFKKLFVTFASIALIGGCVSCTPKSSAKLEKITITHEPTKKEYFVGEQLDTAGLEVTAFYSNSTFKVVTDYTTSGFDSSAANPSVTVTVTYQSKTADFTVKIKEALQEFSITYYVNNTTDFTMIDTTNSRLPNKSLEGSRVDVSVLARSGYDYTGFFVTGPDVPDSFYDQFENYTMKESQFSFVMPHSTVVIYLGAETHAERYAATFASVAHATFSFHGSLESPFKQGDKVEFNIAVDNGYELNGMPFIVGDPSIEISVSTTYIYSFTMPAKAVQISANVQERVAQTYKVTLDTVANVTMSKHPSVEDLNNVEAGAVVVINVVPATGYELVGLPYIVGDSSITVTKSDTAANGYVFLMPAKDVTFSCTVQSSTPSTKYQVSFANVNHITFTLSGTSETSFAAGTTVRFYVDLDSGYRLNGYPFAVNDSGVEIEHYSSTVYQFDMPARAVTISANVEAIPTFAVTLDNVDHVTMTPSGNIDLTQVEEGAQVTIVVAAESGYELSGMPFIVGDTSIEMHQSSTVTNGYYFEMPGKNVTFSCTVVESVVEKYEITFAEIQYVTFRQISPAYNPCEAGESFQFEVTLVEGVSIASGPYIEGDSSIIINKDQYGVYFFSVPEKDVTVTLTTSGTPKVLNYITIEGTPKTEYQVGDTFVKPTIRAYFTGGHPSEDVTSQASFTGYNMSVAGNYTVTVSFSKGGVTDTKTYDITVSGKTPSTSVVTNTLYEWYTSNTKVKGFRFMFMDNGTGYYERYWTNDSVNVINRVWFTYTISGTVLTATYSHYDSDYSSSMSRFDNPYKIFVDNYTDYQSIEINLYTDCVEAYLLRFQADQVTRSTTPTNFALHQD